MQSTTEKTYDVSRTVDPLKHIETIKDIFSYLGQYDDWSDEKIFIDGEYDSNQTKFERASNNGEIGVLSNNDDVGYCLLVFLRMIIDKNFSLFFAMFEIESVYDSDDNGEENEDNVIAEIDRTNFNLTIQQIFNVLKKRERTYTEIYEQNKEIKIELMSIKGTTITININKSDIDLWNLPRIRDESLRLLEEERTTVKVNTIKKVKGTIKKVTPNNLII